MQPYYYLSIVLDKQVISSPHIVTPITEGRGEISGNFTLEEAQNLALQLRYGALPIPLKVESYRAVGPTLGQESVQRSIRAGVIGLSIVLLFMLIYYRVPGFLADLASDPVRPAQPGPVQAHPGDPHPAGHHRLYPVHRHGGRRQHPGL